MKLSAKDTTSSVAVYLLTGRYEAMHTAQDSFVLLTSILVVTHMLQCVDTDHAWSVAVSCNNDAAGACLVLGGLSAK